MIMVNIQDEHAGLFLIVLGVGAVIFVRKLGYFAYVKSDEVYSWFKELGDHSGITLERRSFLNLQIEISRSKDIKTLWNNICLALSLLNFDKAKMQLLKTDGFSLTAMKKPLSWSRDGFYNDKDIFSKNLMKLELPLIDKDTEPLGTIWLIKDLRRAPISHYTLKRIEHLRRTIISAVLNLNAASPS